MALLPIILLALGAASGLEMPFKLPHGDAVERYGGEDCYRNCTGLPKICYFKFHLENYGAMGAACFKCANSENFADCFRLQCIPADGVERGMNSINRELPGPAINVCQNDLLVIDVINKIDGSTTSLHMHGLSMRDSPFMDGVPYVSQCPIAYGSQFRYAFWVTEAGTHMYHSHSGHQKGDGIHGQLVVRRLNDPSRHLYDVDIREHQIIISDWMHYLTASYFPGLPGGFSGQEPATVLINGKGQYHSEGIDTSTPLAVFKVKPGKRYRFRFINGNSQMCQAQLQIESHRMKIFSSDSYEVKPSMFDTLVTTSGERYDFVLEANQEPGDYCMRLKMLGYCEADKLIEQFAILTYSDSDEENVTLEDYERASKLWSMCRRTEWGFNRALNHPNMTCHNAVDENDDLCTVDLKGVSTYHSEEERIRILTSEPDVVHDFTFGLHFVSPGDIFKANHYEHFSNPAGIILLYASLNRIASTSPTVSLLTQPEDWNDSDFCDPQNMPKKCEGEVVCNCPYRVKVKLGDIVEFRILHQASYPNEINHPFHMHGTPMYLVDSGQRDPSGNFTRIPISLNSPLKDTVTLPSFGYAVVRFKADNPGVWLFHCHIGYHITMGMGVVVQIGEKEDFAKPPRDFPKCGVFKPDIAEIFSGNLTNFIESK